MEKPADPDEGQTRHLLMRAADALFVEKGYDSVGIRQIAQAAGLSTGTAHYHFSSKRDMFLAVAKWCSEHVVRELTLHLDKAEMRASGRLLTVEEIMAAFTAGTFASQRGEVSGRRFSRLMLHLAVLENRKAFQRFFLEILGSLYRRYLSLLCLALPRHDAAVVEAGFHMAQMMLYGIVGDFHAFLSFSDGESTQPDFKALESLVVPFLSAGLRKMPVSQDAGYRSME